MTVSSIEKLGKPLLRTMPNPLLPTAHSIALITVGGFLVICFILWERFGARHPLIPFTLLTNRTVIAAFVIALVHPAAGGVIGSYL